jgi:uncharacterized protein
MEESIRPRVAATPRLSDAEQRCFDHVMSCREHEGVADLEELEGCGCLARLASTGWLSGTALPLAGIDDAEGAHLPDGIAPVIDAHVHVFPDPLFDALWRWFEAHAWPIRYRLRTPELVAFLLRRGIERVVALTYAHKPGMARGLNAYVAELVLREPRVIGLGTVLPGEPDVESIVDEAFASGLAGLKLHCHVQCFAPDDPRLLPIFERAASAGRPVVMHAGREPTSPAYACDPHALCSAERVERVLRDFPRLELVVPHLGADEFGAYGRLLERYDNLWLDTTMAIADYFPIETPWDLVRVRPERVLFGTDFPNLPYAWDRELTKLLSAGLDDEALAKLLGGNAAELFKSATSMR